MTILDDQPRKPAELTAPGLRKERIDAALGLLPADVVLTGGRVVNVFTREILRQSVVIWRDRIVSVGRIPDGSIGPRTDVREMQDAYLVPGFIEPHFHCADSSLAMRPLAAALLERGTTSLGSDMVELYGLGGLAAVTWGIESAEDVGLRILFMLPLHSLGMENFGTFLYPPKLDDYLTMASWQQTIAVNEPPPNVVLRGHEGVLQVIDAVTEQRKVFEGHAPGLIGTDLQAYIAAGASSDHEAVEASEALDKLRLGYRIIMRECAASRDLDALAPLIVKYPDAARFFMVGSDDMQAKEFLSEGHIDHKLRRVIAAGVDPTVAVQLATINPAEYFGLADHLGSISPGKVADLLVIDDLAEMRPQTVIASGRVVAENGRYRGDKGRTGEVPDYLRSRVTLGRTIGPDDFLIPAPITEGTVRVRVMGIVDGTLVSEAQEHDCQVSRGQIEADPVSDILKIAILDRHHGSGAIGKGFVQGFGLRNGAVATTAVWQHFSLLVIGTSDTEMAAAVREMTQLKGGVLVVGDGRLIKGVSFPIGGVAGTAALEEMVQELSEFEEAIRNLGCNLSQPFTSLAFAAIPHIPHYGITDRGWYDTFREEFVDVVLSDASH